MKLSTDILTVEIGSEGYTIHHNLGPAPRMVFDADGVIGWDDSPDVKRERTSRPHEHGDFSEAMYYEGRLVTISGHAVANNPQELQKMRDDFSGLFALGEDQMVRVRTSVGPDGVYADRYMIASQGSKLSWVRELDTYARWKIDLYAPDPRIYGVRKSVPLNSKTRDLKGLGFSIGYPLDFGTPITESSHAVLRNNGNSPAWPIISVKGNMASGFTVTDGANKRIIFSGPVFMGLPVVINTFDGTASVGGVDRSYQLSRREWFSIPPGGDIKPQLIPHDSENVTTTLATADIEYSDTWA